MSGVEELNLANGAEAAATAADWLDRLAAEHGFGPKLVAHLQIMLEEVMANLWAHGADAANSIRVELTLDADMIRLTFSDNGRPFDLRAVESRSVGTSLNDARIGGLGLQLIKKFADRIDYRSEGGWNHLQLFKKRAAP